MRHQTKKLDNSLGNDIYKQENVWYLVFCWLSFFEKSETMIIYLYINWMKINEELSQFQSVMISMACLFLE